MKLLVTYRNGKSETYVGVEQINPVKNEAGKTESIYVESFASFARLERPLNELGGGIKKMELLF